MSPSTTLQRVRPPSDTTSGLVPGAAFRTALVNRLRAARTCQVVTIVAPAGYGKSTLLAQWASRDARPFVWGTPGDVPSATPGTVHVVDDAHLLDHRGAAAVARLIASTPAGAQVVLAGRSLRRLPGLSLPRLRAAGGLLELGPRDLALTSREAARLLKILGAPAAASDLAVLLQRTEGWAAGVGHAAAARATHSPGVLDGNGITRAFFREECLAGLTAEQRTFLRRTSVLDRMTGPLCDAVLERSGSAQELETLEQLGLFLVPLDRNGEWYRYHHLLRDELRRELAEVEPGRAAALHARAAAWCEANGDSDGAITHAEQAGEPDRALRVFGESALLAHDDGRARKVADWLSHMDAAALAGAPQAAVLAARLHAHHGRLEQAERCLAAAEKGARRGTTKAVRARIALVRAALCAGGPESMLADAERGVAGVDRHDPWYAYGLLLQGTAHALLGRPGPADAILSRAAHAAGRMAAVETRILALCERAALASVQERHADAERYVAAALDDARQQGLEGYGVVALALVLEAQGGLRAGRWAQARASMARAQLLLPALTAALPWLAVQARLGLARAHVMLRDAASARALLREVDSITTTRPELGLLHAERSGIAREIRAIPAAHGQTARLTAAELRLLPLLATHLSFREIGACLFLSRHTVKTQAISAYRKLGASSRKEAVVCAGALGLIETSPECPKAAT